MNEKPTTPTVNDTPTSMIWATLAFWLCGFLVGFGFHDDI